MSYLIMYTFIHVYMFGYKNNYLWFAITHEQYCITHELIQLSRDSLVSNLSSENVCDLDACKF